MRSKGGKELKALIKKFYKEQKLLTVLLALVFVISFSTTVFASTADTASLDNIMKWFATWAGRVGLCVAFFGGLQTALAFKNDDADAKTRGLKTLAAGFMTFGLSQSLSLFGL